jgi:hypothetical protein
MTKIMNYFLKMCMLIVFTSHISPTFAEIDEPKVDRERWLYYVEDHLSKNLCDKLTKETTCYHKNINACKTAVAPYIQSCIADNKNQIPAQLSNEEANKWGGNIGNCVGQKVFINLSEDPDNKSCMASLQ